MGSAASTAVYLAQRKRKTGALLFRYGDTKGEVQEAFDKIKASQTMRLAWLEKWQSMDKDGSRLLDYPELLKTCGLEDNMWSSRVFDLLDKNIIGCVDLFTFVSSLPRLLVFDRLTAIEVAFRMCGRRGATCDLENAVLDEKDIRLFVEDRYPTLDRRHALNRTVEILAHLDADCSGGVSLEEFRQFCDMNPIFLTAVQGTLRSIRHFFFGEQFWKDFTKRAWTFDEATQKEIFFSPETVLDGNITAVAPTTTLARSVAAVTNAELQTAASTASNQRKRKLGDITALVQSAAGNFKRITSEPSLVRHVALGVSGYFSAAEKGKRTIHRLKLWSSAASRNAAEKNHSLMMNKARAGKTFRRVVSDSDLKLRGGLESTSLWVQTVKSAEIKISLRGAGKRAGKRLADKVCDMPYGKRVIRYMPAQKMGKTRQLLAKSAREPSESGSITRDESTQKVLKTKEMLIKESSMLAGRIDAIRAIGNLKTAPIAAMAIRRMQALAEAARKERKLGPPATLSKASLVHLVSALPKSMPTTETTRSVGRHLTEASKAGGSRALAALKRTVGLITIVKYLNDASGQNQKESDQERNVSGFCRTSLGNEEGQPEEYETDSTEGELVKDELKLADEEGLQKAVVGAEAINRKRNDTERRWAATAQFYAHLVTATERLEAKMTAEKGCDFSADFPKLWNTSQIHISHDPGGIQFRQEQRSSASRKTAKIYLCFLALWQRPSTGRPQLAVAFNQWRLNTCDAAVEEKHILAIEECGERYSVDGRTLRSDTPSTRKIQSVKEMWEAAGGAYYEQDLHAIIMNKASADRPLPSELCKAYERDMINRIDRRQAENNVPLVIIPF